VKERELLEEFVNPENVLRGVCKCYVFSFGARKGDNRLLFGTPRDSTKSDEVSESGNRVAVTLGSPVGIGKSSNGCITSQDELEVLRTKQIAENMFNFNSLHVSGMWCF